MPHERKDSPMINLEELKINAFVAALRSAYRRNYRKVTPDHSGVIAWAGRLSLENIANTDALYHNVDHTIMVTLVGQEILKGKHLSEGGVSPDDWMNFILALLFHDIGYVRGVCKADRDGIYASGVDGGMVEVAANGTDAALTPFHVDRGKLFILERFGKRTLVDVDIEMVTNCIELTRAPIPEGEFYQDTSGYPGLARAADYIGQLGDPNYLRNLPALFYEFEEIHAGGKSLYGNPGEMRRDYAKFYWNVVARHIQGGIRYLKVTQEGKQWLANLYSHVFSVEHIG